MAMIKALAWLFLAVVYLMITALFVWIVFNAPWDRRMLGTVVCLVFNGFMVKHCIGRAFDRYVDSMCAGVNR
jgi:hypothetical protein